MDDVEKDTSEEQLDLEIIREEDRVSPNTFVEKKTYYKKNVNIVLPIWKMPRKKQ